MSNLVNHIGNNVTVWHTSGNALENRRLITVDEFGVVVTNQPDGNAVFIHWSKINYIDILPTMTDEQVKDAIADLIKQSGPYKSPPFVPQPPYMLFNGPPSTIPCNLDDGNILSGSFAEATQKQLDDLKNSRYTNDGHS